MLHRAPLSLSRALSASMFGGAEGSENVHRVDSAAALREATERNAREAQVGAVAWAEADAQAAVSTLAKALAVLSAQAKATTKEQAKADAKAVEDPAGGRIPEAGNLEWTEPRVVETHATS